MKTLQKCTGFFVICPFLLLTLRNKKTEQKQQQKSHNPHCI
uniref:Uncharacterized protein n=1 Tax=Anguilla anguilla TaxID=7936 RepID=A0A0E9W3I8_ANGAN